MGPWGDRKNRINQRRRHLSFETAQLVFEDPFAVTAEDYIDDNGEMRYQTLGLVDGLLIFVAHVLRIVDDEATPWIVSARKAVKNEEEIYWSSRGKG
jgi:uncharacterized protein